MDDIQVTNWDGFELELKQLREVVNGSNSQLLFRGQHNAQWQLVTTLERAGQEGMRFSEYYRLVTKLGAAISTFAQINWDVPSYQTDVDDSFKQYDTFHSFPSVDLYRYLVYLRHHGLPSPLLDWSHSPYVAAFFAFRDSNSDAEKVSIYAFCENPMGYNSWSSDQPQIRRIGPYVSAHRRHFFQQSDYTICGKFDLGWNFARHEYVFRDTSKPQDFYGNSVYRQLSGHEFCNC